MTPPPDPSSPQARAIEERLRAVVLGHLLTSPLRFNGGAMHATARELGAQPGDVAQTLWALAADGLVFLDPNGQPSPDNWLWRPSRLARAAAQGREWEPREPRGFLVRLDREAPDLDLIARQYVEEALRCFNGGSYLGSSVMLGVASEQAVLVLARAVVAAVPAPSLQKKVTNPKAKAWEVFDQLRLRLDPIRKELPEGLADVLTFDAVADLLRVNRNEAGHPTGALVDRDTAHVHLQVAATYLGKLSALTRHFLDLTREGGSGDAISG